MENDGSEEPLRYELSSGMHLLAVCLNVYYLISTNFDTHTHTHTHTHTPFGYLGGSLVSAHSCPPKLIYELLKHSTTPLAFPTNQGTTECWKGYIYPNSESLWLGKIWNPRSRLMVALGWISELLIIFFMYFASLFFVRPWEPGKTSFELS